MLRDRTFSVHPKGGVPRSSEEVILRNGAESNTSGDSVIPAAVTREKNFRAWSAGVRVPMAEPRKKKQEKKKKKQQQQQKQPQLEQNLRKKGKRNRAKKPRKWGDRMC